MTVVRASLLIHCSIQKVFDYVVLPEHGPAYIPFLKETADITPVKPGPHQTFHWIYTISGIIMKGTATVTTFETPHSYVLTTSGNIISTWTFSFTEGEEGTYATITISYDFEQNIVKAIINRLIIDKFNQKILEDVLENLRAQLETGNT